MTACKTKRLYVPE